MPEVSLLMVSSGFVAHQRQYRGVCEDLADRLSGEGLRVHTTSSRPRALWRSLDMVFTAWKLRRGIDLALVDVFSGRAFLWAEAVGAVLRLARKPFILVLRGGALPAFARRRPGRARRLLNSARAVIALTGYHQDSLKPCCDHIRLIPNPIDVGQYGFHLRDAPQPRLVWLRAFHTIYNPDLAAKTLALLHRDFPSAHLLMVGPDKRDGSRQQFEALVCDHGLESAVEIVGGVPKADVGRWLNKGDIFLNTTFIDNAPVSVSEAMACGLCIVSTDVGGLPYLVQDGHDALLVPPDDPEAMAGAVRRILTEPGLAGRLSQQARESVMKRSWTQVLPQWLALIEEITGKEN